MMVRRSRRLILADDNIRTVGGHFFELASLLLRGGEELGFQPLLATHRKFSETDKLDSTWRLDRRFSTRRLVRWSLGVDGGSRVERDLTGRPIGASRLQTAIASVRERCRRQSRQPRVMLRQWSNEFASLLREVRPTPQDRIILNTSDDFALLALANAINEASPPDPVHVDALFHFAVREGDSPRSMEAARRYGRQVRRAVEATRPHRIHLHATTDALARQMVQAGVGADVTVVPYPTRPRTLRDQGAPPSQCKRPLRILLAGLPRPEKGRECLAELLANIEHSCLRNGSYEVSLQMPPKRWERMIPSTLAADYRAAIADDAATGGPFHIKTANLSTDDYHAWLDTADVGLFLYDPARYVARCSGVLLEMFVRGVPVIVPDGCWLADQVRQASAFGCIGMVYQSRCQIPEMLTQMRARHSEMRVAAARHASSVSKVHSGQNTLLTMWREPAVVGDSSRSAQRSVICSSERSRAA